MGKIPLIDCQNLVFSTRLAENRMAQALMSFGSLGRTSTFVVLFIILAWS
jgi:hypothetical protein